MSNKRLGIWAAVGLVAAVVLSLAGWWSTGGAASGWWGICPMCGGGSAWGATPGPWGGGPGFAGLGMFMMMLAMVLFWAAPIVGLVALIRWLTNRSSAERPDETVALEIARTRYAKGEISRDEFERLREDLTHASHAS